MLVSVFTPSHDPTYLDAAWGSLCAQTRTDWEWVVLLNGGAEWVAPEDPRIRVEHSTATGIGALKREACGYAMGDVLIELDHDDLLVPTCLDRIVETFTEDPDAVLVYSDWTQINADETPNTDLFSADYGWTYRMELNHLVCEAMAPTPHNVAYIWYAPNHVRAFRRGAYDLVGGYDADAKVLDDQDLMARLYQVGAFVHLPECLYRQRVHDGNTQVQADVNPQIQVETVEKYWGSVTELATAWAQREGLAVLDVSPEWAGGDCELSTRIPDNSVGVIFAREVLQRKTPWFFDECYRVLAPGGMLVTVTPSTDGRGAFQDPSHTSYWNENSFWYLTQTHLRERTYPGSSMRWQTSGIRTVWCDHSIAYVEANLLAIKDGPRQGGPLL